MHTANNPETCLFCDKRGLTEKDVAELYLAGQTYKLEDRERCENGTHVERQLYKFLMKYHNDQYLHLRNSQWAPEIIRILGKERHSTVVFAFGAAHFRGKHRVQKYLQEAGFEVEYMRADEPFV